MKMKNHDVLSTIVQNAVNGVCLIYFGSDEEDKM